MPTTTTVTYDPADDSVVMEADTARDQETLEVGEKMLAEQENLLAGKYRKPEDLEAAYLELQKKLGDQESTPAEEEVQEDPAPEQLDPASYYQEDGSVNYDTAEQVYGEKISEVFKDNEIDPFKMNEYFVENNGTLSDEMYDTLGKAGLTKNLVDSYLEGVRNQVGMENVQPDPVSPVLTDAEVAEVKTIAGGEQGYNDLMAWAGDNISDVDAKNFDDVIETGNKAAVTFAVKALMAQYEDAQGRDTNLITGKKSKTETYRSMAEVVRDMGNPLYDRDEAYREDVRRKLEASNIKV
tara:strand:- start:2459 stop:3346 length:888 start_codon:yes stop_codon:yes gene_type:complete